MRCSSLSMKKVASEVSFSGLMSVRLSSIGMAIGRLPYYSDVSNMGVRLCFGTIMSSYFLYLW